MHDALTETELHQLSIHQLKNETISILTHNNLKWDTVDKNIALEALKQATRWHKNQTRFTEVNQPREPYINHPMRNMIRAFQWGVVEVDLLVAILLHDVLEDCAHRVLGEKKDETIEGHKAQRARGCAVIQEKFSTHVADLVVSVTNPIVSACASREEKRKSYLNHLSNTLTDPEVFIVKLADFVDNAGSLDRSFDENKVVMFKHLWTKYDQAWDVFSEELENHSFDQVVESNMARALLEVHESLGQVAKNW